MPGIRFEHARRSVFAALASLGAALSLLPPGALAAPGDARARQAEIEWSHDGLRRTSIAGLDLAYVREDARLETYDKVWLRTVQVAFRRDWRVPAQPGSRIVATDLARIKDGLARVVRDAATRELREGGVTLAEGPGEGVLEVDVSIVDLYLNALDVRSFAPVQRYALSVGEMTLVAELRDAPSGEILARVLDRRVGRDRARFELTTSVDNAGEVQDAARAWARVLRERLAAARGATAQSR